ncbi:MAG: glycosyltransferase family 4 protein [Gemmatimonadota bacterium]|nr:glycosyltransferase family 4 protein [Gemmatimonadota bacterium]
MRILLIAPQPFFAQRGTPINVRQMVQTLCEAGHEVHLATYPMGEPVSMPGLVMHRALPIPGVRTVPIGFSWRKVALDIALAMRVWPLIAGRRFDVVHAVEESVFFALPAARLRGIPVIYDLDSWMSDQLAYGGRIKSQSVLKFLRRIERCALHRSSLAITVSASLSDTVRAMEPNVRVAQIEDCPLEEALRAPDLSRVALLRERFGIGQRKAIVYTGNLEGYQGIELLLDAFARVARSRDDTALVLVGGSPQQVESTRARAATLGVGERVVLTGQRPAEEMPEWMAMGDVLVSPRLHGGNTPLKLFSYMWSAVPIVATDLPTHTQVLDASAAVLRAPTPDAMASGLLAVLDDPARFASIGAVARARVSRDYSREAFSRKLLAAYDSIAPGVRSSVATSM